MFKKAFGSVLCTFAVILGILAMLCIFSGKREVDVVFGLLGMVTSVLGFAWGNRLKAVPVPVSSTTPRRLT